MNANERQTAMFGCPTATLDADVSEAKRNAADDRPGRGDPVVGIVLSLLSDAQELTAMGAVDGRPEYAEDAEQLMNRAKYIADTYLVAR